MRHHHIFGRILDQARTAPPVPAAVVYPLSAVALRGALEASGAKVILPMLIGPGDAIQALAEAECLSLDGCRMIEAEDDIAAARLGVDLCRTGKAGILMKGSLHTAQFMHAVLAGHTGLRAVRRVTHVFILDVPAYPHMLLITDAAVNIAPDLACKADIVRNAIDLAHVLHIEEPKVAILSAVETVTPSIPSTIDAAALCKMAERGQITGGILDGPLAFDNAVSLRAARIKHIESPVAGRADILVVPDLEAGNMLAKQLEYLAEAEMAGIVLGARVPIVLTSRADGAKARLASCAVAALMAQARRKAGPGAGDGHAAYGPEPGNGTRERAGR